MKNLKTLGIALAASFGMFAATSANAIVILGNHDDAVGASTPSFNGSAIDTQQSKGVQFTTSDTYNITSLVLALQNLNEAPALDSDDHLITIRAGDIDGAVVGTFDQTTPDINSQGGAARTFGFSSSSAIVIAPGTYSFVLEAGANSYNWSVADDPQITPTGVAAFDNYRISNTAVNGGAVSNSGIFNSFRLEGDVVAAPVPVPSAILLMGLPLIYVARRRKV